MATRTLRSAANATPPEPAPPTPEEECCVICLEPITDAASRVTLRCCHAFHGQCLCTHLVNDGRCPICRDSPYNCDFSDEDDALAEEEPAGVSLSEAMSVARASADKRTQKMLKTYRKWKKESKNARKAGKELYKRIQPLEDAMYERIEAFEKKQRERFDQAHKDTFARMKENAELVKKRSAKTRIAKKHGWTGCVWRSRRSRFEHPDDLY